MALSHSPSIVTDGLVLCLDAANPRSYPGTGTTAYDVSGTNYDASFTTLSVQPGYIDFNSSSSSTITFPSISKSSWTITYSIKPTGTPISDYRSVIRLLDTNGLGFFISDTRTVATPYILHYARYYDGTTFGSYWTRQMLSAAAYATYPWGIYTCSFDGTNFKNYFNGVLLGTDVITGSFAGYTDINRLQLSPSGSQVINMGFVHLYNTVLTDQQVLSTVTALGGRYGV